MMMMMMIFSVYFSSFWFSSVLWISFASAFDFVDVDCENNNRQQKRTDEKGRLDDVCSPSTSAIILLIDRAETLKP
jgi:hypothetical protein